MSVRIAIGVIINDENQVLITKRSAKQHQGNKWEFPGGKVETEETSQEALCRELKEEVGIDVQITDFLMNISHSYDDKKVLLDVYEVKRWAGEARSLEDQLMKWVKKSDLKNYEFPDANADILRKLT
ncbi:MAG: 8-oxo-dGTP diphosphatase MutT [Cocleimonas sp.]